MRWLLTGKERISDVQYGDDVIEINNLANCCSKTKLHEFFHYYIILITDALPMYCNLHYRNVIMSPYILFC